MKYNNIIIPNVIDIFTNIFEKAIEQNESIAKSNLAEMYIFGHGVEPNPKKALELYEEALNDARDKDDEDEISIVLFNIAEMYEKG